MEILIPGLILVALMIYASTKIKKDAAAAFEQEPYVGEHFSLTKPDGFIIPADMADGVVFQTYTKDSGQEATELLRQVSAEIRIFDRADLDSRREEIAANTNNILSEKLETYSMSRALYLEAEGEKENTPIRLFYKLIADNTKVYQLEIAVLPENLEEYSERIEQMLESFSAE